MLDRVGDVGLATKLQQLPRHGRRDGSRQDVPDRQGPRGGEAEADHERPDVHDDGGDERHDPDPGPERTRAAGDRQQAGGQDDSRPDGSEQQQCPATRLDRVGSVVARHRPDGVHGALSCQGDAEPAVHGPEQAHDDTDGPAAEPLGGAQLPADDGELPQRRAQHRLLQHRVAPQDHAEHRGGQQQQREQRQERVVGDQGGQVSTVVVEELVRHGQRVAGPAVPALVGVDPCGEPHRSPSLSESSQAVGRASPALLTLVHPAQRPRLDGRTHRSGPQGPWSQAILSAKVGSCRGAVNGGPRPRERAPAAAGLDRPRGQRQARRARYRPVVDT